ncbi:hypothetical protein FRC12_015100 [Ceratobasidium sp. 428]|nr:hypothetical protein FRC12_015100 [Ceratobasidium sp. 428]
MQSFFQVCELLDLTFSHLSNQDHYSLLLVSRKTFYSAARIIWKTLKRTSDLIILIRGARLVPLVRDKVEHVELPTYLDESHFLRFNLYAQFVRSIHVSHHSDLPTSNTKHGSSKFAARLDNLLNWQSLLDYAENRVLLPNLADVHSADPDYQSAASWLYVLLSPSVRRLSISSGSPRARWPPEAMSRLLDTVSSKAPYLEFLMVFPEGFTSYSIEKDVNNRTLFARQETFCHSLSGLRNLRTIFGNIAVLYPSALWSLGQLPSLNQLRCISAGGGLLRLKYNDLPSDDMFPSLRNLDVTDVNRISWIMDLWDVAPLVKRLHHINICISANLTPEPELGHHWADTLLLHVCSRSPETSGISFNFFPTFPPHQEPPLILISPHVLSAFARLSLKHFGLGGAHFGIGACETLSSIWPNLATLYCPKQSASLLDLANFARNLPNLESLVIDLDMNSWGIPDYFSTSFVPSPRYETFRYLSRETLRPCSHTSAQISALARYLYFLWPNICCARGWPGFCEVKPSSYNLPEERQAWEELRKLDKCIDQMRSDG